MEDTNFFDAEDKVITAEQEKAANIKRMKELDDLRWVLSNIKGRRFIWKVLSSCGAFHASYVPKDANQTAFNEGRRDIGLRLLRDLGHANPKAYSQMEDEILAENGKKRKVE
jgi:hypothetical protein